MAINGYDAIELIQKASFDVIVSDQQMPEMNGVEFLQHAKNLSPDTIRFLHIDSENLSLRMLSSE